MRWCLKFKAVLNIDDLFLLLVNMYGFKLDSQNREMLQNIIGEVKGLKALYRTNLILIGGDWNMTPDEWEDRWPSKYIWRIENPGMREFTWYKPNHLKQFLTLGYRGI
uniref:Endonuclease/exonuclease/phosphatase domain-containing protein n=1 Tax=Oryzias latipes TaxID=8090 RepID=A0A3P9H1Y8_ORYLA